MSKVIPSFINSGNCSNIGSLNIHLHELGFHSLFTYKSEQASAIDVFKKKRFENGSLLLFEISCFCG